MEKMKVFSINNARTTGYLYGRKTTYLISHTENLWWIINLNIKDKRKISV